MTHPEAPREVFILQKGQLPQLLMHAAIAELAGAGESALAAELEQLRVRWSTAVRRRAAISLSRRQRLQHVMLRLGTAVGLTPLEQAKASVRGLREEAERA
jgi:hypothetical protein